NLAIASARLINTTEGVVPDDGSAATSDEEIDEANSGLLLSDLLLQLRAFPIRRMSLADLEVPQFRQKIALNLEQDTDALQLQMTSGTLQFLTTFSQASPDTTAQMRMSLEANGTTVGEMAVSMLPQPSGYQLAGNGNVNFSDANTPFAEYLKEPLPFSSIDLEWELAANVVDDFLNNSVSEITLNLAGGSALVLRPGLVPDLGELTVEFAENAELKLDPAAAMSITTADMPLGITGSWQGQRLQSNVVLTPTECQLVGVINCSSGFDGNASLSAYVVASDDPAAGITINTIEFAGAGSVNVNDAEIAVSVSPDARVSSGSVVGASYNIASLNMVVGDAGFATNIDSASSTTSVATEQLAVTLTDFKFGDYQVSADLALRNLSLTVADTLTGKMTLQTDGLQATGSQWLPSIGLNADLSIDGDMVAFNTPLLLANAPSDAQLQVSGAYDLAAGTGEIHLELPTLTLTGTGNSLSSYLSGWPYPADVMTGTLALNLDVQLQPGDAAGAESKETIITGNTKIVLTDVAGFYEESFFRGLSTTLEGTYNSSAPTLPITTPPLLLTIDELNVGMPITNVALNYQLDANNQLANISSISASVLDGSVSGTDINYDFGKEVNEMTFVFSGLRLERMLDLAEYEGIEAVGAVSGEIPVIITNGKIEVGAGKLYAEAPGGSIKYVGAPIGGAGNPAMDLVNQALSNYQFQSLDSSIDYSPEGELLLGMQLRGHNPDMNGGQAINLNLNISDNIPTLLKSLQAGRVIEDFLQEQYK
ncbi:MAG: YdbH domain-containing protein, partial [Pseudomonadota bacterium]